MTDQIKRAIADYEYDSDVKLQDKERLTAILTDADNKWGVTPGMSLAWNGLTDGPVITDQELTPEILQRLASVISDLNKAGIKVRLGRSGSDHTYLSIELDDWPQNVGPPDEEEPSYATV